MDPWLTIAAQAREFSLNSLKSNQPIAESGMQLKSATQNLQCLYGGYQSIESSLSKLFLENHLQDHQKDILKCHWTTCMCLRNALHLRGLLPSNKDFFPAVIGTCFGFPTFLMLAMRIYGKYGVHCPWCIRDQFAPSLPTSGDYQLVQEHFWSLRLQ